MAHPHARVICIYFAHPVSDIQTIAEIFYRATPYVTWRRHKTLNHKPLGYEALFLEISKCQALYREPTFLARTRATLRRIALDAHLAIADDVGTALGLAFFRLDCKSQLPIEAVTFYVDPLGNQLDTEARLIEMAQTLRLMGVKTIGDFLRLPQYELASRFSRFGLLAYLRAQGQNDIVWPPFCPREHVIERFVFDEEAPAQNLEMIYFPLRPMIERAVLRLRARRSPHAGSQTPSSHGASGLRARQIDIVLQHECASGADHDPNGSSLLSEREKRFSIFIQLPHVGSKVIFQILREKLENSLQTKSFFERPISEMRLEVVETAPYSLTQKNLFDQKKEENEESFFQLISRLATRLGPTAVFFAEPHASYLPEKNWRRVHEADSLKLTNDETVQPKAAKKIQHELPERPLRLLPKPIPLQWAAEHWTVRNKEVLLADWWEPRIYSGDACSTTPYPASVERVYFRLISKDPTMPDLWVFRTVTHGSSSGSSSHSTYFLHGVFE